MTEERSNASDASTAGMTGQDISNTQYNRFGMKGGTGFAFEDMNALEDQLAGHRVEPVGGTNAPNGPDRIVNGQAIQSKCFSSARQSVMDAFANGGKGNYRYEGQQLEVPKGQGEQAREIMRKQIEAGKVPGVEDSRAAENLVQESKYTYEQACNIAKGGTLDSLIYDAKTGAVVCLFAAGLGATIDLAVKLWNGVPVGEALAGVPDTALRVGLTAMGAHIGAAQLMRTQVWRTAQVGIRSGVEALAKTNGGMYIVEKIAVIGGGGSEAALTRATKVLSSSGAAAIATTVAVTLPDGYRALAGQASWAQAGKNLVCNAGSVGGGTVGWVAGAAAGAALGSAIPLFGTAVGALVGGLLGSLGVGAATGKGVRYAMDLVVKDDAVEMMEWVQNLLPASMDRQVLGDAERGALCSGLPKVFTAATLREMYASHERKAFAEGKLDEACAVIVSQRIPLDLTVVLAMAEYADVNVDAPAEMAANDEVNQSERKQA